MRSFIATFLILSLCQTFGFCSCHPDSYSTDAKVIQQWFSKSGAVFIGEPLKADVLNDREAKILFKIQKLYKGTAKDKIEIFQPAQWYTSGSYYEDEVRFEIGVKYLVYAEQYNGKLRVGYCSRSRGIEKAYPDINVDLKILDEIIATSSSKK